MTIIFRFDTANRAGICFRLNPEAFEDFVLSEGVYWNHGMIPAIGDQNRRFMVSFCDIILDYFVVRNYVIGILDRDPFGHEEKPARPLTPFVPLIFQAINIDDNLFTENNRYNGKNIHPETPKISTTSYPQPMVRINDQISYRMLCIPFAYNGTYLSRAFLYVFNLVG